MSQLSKAVGPRVRARAALFGAYSFVVFLLAYLAAPSVVSYLWPSETRWVVTAYAVVAALGLVGMAVGGSRRAARLDARLDQIEGERRETASRFQASEPLEMPDPPTDQDVDRLLTELHQTRSIVEAGDSPYEDVPDALPLSESGRAVEARLLEGRRATVPAAVAGPAFACAVVVGLYTSLLPASDGLLLSDPQLNALLWLAGAGWLLGIAGYAIRSLRALSARAG